MVAFVAGLFFSQALLAGGRFTEQGNKLSEALYNELVKKGICSADTHACAKPFQMYREDDGNRIYLNLYGQKDMLLASKIVEFYVKKGLKITDGMPITFKVFPEPKEHYLGFFKGLFGNNEQSLKLELNK